jgi:hypothetical protein
MTTYFITGAEGVGKSSFLKILKQKFLDIDFHDFDELGVPKNPPLQWRLDTTLYWIKKSIENQEDKIDTCIIGLSFPKEIKSFEEFSELEEVYFCLLDISKEERERRLIKRGAEKEVIQDVNQLVKLRNQFKNFGEIIDVSENSIEKNSEKIIKFLKNKK